MDALNTKIKITCKGRGFLLNEKNIYFWIIFISVYKKLISYQNWDTDILKYNFAQLRANDLFLK